MIVTEAIARAQWSPEYQAIREHYADRVARVSGVPLMQQVEEGLIVLDAIDASEDAMRAFCLRPLFQTDEDLVRYGQDFMDAVDASPSVILLVMEYRSRANAWLSEKVHRSSVDPQVVVAAGLPSVGPLEAVRDMLIADKVQGRKQFIRDLRGRHARSDELDLYFNLWLQALEVEPEEYDGLCASIDFAARRATPRLTRDDLWLWPRLARRLIFALERTMNLFSLALTALAAGTFSMAAEAQEKASSFDGIWQVHLTCEDTRDRNGAVVKGYVFDFPADVKAGELLGQRGDEGDASSLRLDGTIAVSGEALIQAHGYTGKPDYTVGHVRPASPYAYTLRGRFDAKHGHVERQELRRCSADFERFAGS